MIVLDTSLLVDALAGPRASAPHLMNAFDSGERIGLLSLVFYEWLRGPRTAAELATQEALFSIESIIVFDADDAKLAAKLDQSVRRARGREVDLAIAACTIRRQAELWTLNRADFSDIPGLKLYAKSNFS